MNSKSFQIIASSSLMIVWAAGGAMAQEQGTSSDAPSKLDTASSPQVERSSEQALSEARAVLVRMRAQADAVSLMLKSAQDSSDLVKSMCLDDKVGQMNIALESAGDRLASMESAAAASNGERVSHDEAVLGALSGRTAEIGMEAEQCIGEESLVQEDESSELEVLVDPSIPSANVAAPAARSVVSAPPVASSPTI